VFSAEVNRKYRCNENEWIDADRWGGGAGRRRQPAGVGWRVPADGIDAATEFIRMTPLIAGTPCFPGVQTGRDEIPGPRGPAGKAGRFF